MALDRSKQSGYIIFTAPAGPRPDSGSSTSPGIVPDVHGVVHANIPTLVRSLAIILVMVQFSDLLRLDQQQRLRRLARPDYAIDGIAAVSPAAAMIMSGTVAPSVWHIPGE